MKLIFLLLLLHFNWVFAETPMVGASLTLNTETNNQTTDKNTLQNKINALVERKGLDEALKSRVLATYQAAQDELNNITIFKQRDNEFKVLLKQAPELTKKIQKDIEQASVKSTKLNSEEFKKIPIEELSQRLIFEQEKIKTWDERIKKLENDLVLQESRPNLIRQQTLKAKQDLDNAQKIIKEIKTDEADKLEVDAQQLLLNIQVDARLTELEMLQSENASYSARLALLKDQLHLLQLQKNALMPLISSIEKALLSLKEQEAINQKNALTQAEKELEEKPKVIQDIAKENIKYTQQLQDINNKISLREADKDRVEAQLNQLESDFNKASKKIDLANLSPPLGKLLHEQRRTLLNKDEFVTQSKLISEETVNTDFQQLVIEERLKELNDIDVYLKQLMLSETDENTPNRMMIQAELRSHLNEQVELLNKLAIACNNYLHILGDFDFVRQQKHTKAEQFADYLDENLLWVKSSEALNLNTFKHILSVTKQVLVLSHWQTVLDNFFNVPIKQPFFTLFGVFGLGFLMLLRKWCVQRLVFISEHIGKIYSDRFYYTIEVLIYDAILVLPLPLMTGYVGWLLSNSMWNNFTEAFGMGLMRASVSWFFLQLFYRLFEPNAGLFRKHFLWQEGSVKLIHAQLAWLRFVYIPCSFVIKSTLVVKLLNADELGRLALSIGALSLIIFLQRLFRIKQGLIQYLLINHPEGWVSKSRYLYFYLSFTPLISIGFCLTGYYLSAIELQQKIMVTLIFALFMVIIYELSIRWLNLVNRQLAIQEIQQRRRQQQTHSNIAGSEHPIVPQEELVDIPTINAQTIKILNLVFYFNLIIGFLFIWKNIFPAFSFLEHIELWQVKATVNNKEVYQAITLVNLLLSGVYLFMTVVAVRNFSGAMELLLFRRLATTAGSRYAVNQLAKYSLIALGFLCVTNELGFSWSQVQWLVAALSVGLGFGLQEIFANFVSGIILLFERPIRVGDTVTIGDVSGKVSRIHMRATTLVDFDQKELIVPNKTFITSQLVNWSLSDPITRVVIPVGIAYGSDIDLAHKVMLETVHGIPLVLKDPEPSVVLVAFKDSALEFSIRVFVSETANRMPVTHELHKRLADALHANGIEIPFPQRDVHIRF